MTIKPLADKVVIKLIEAEEKTKSGLILTASAQKKPQIAEVVAVGPGGFINGHEVVMSVKVGDKVVMSNFVHATIRDNSIEYLTVNDGDKVVTSNFVHAKIKDNDTEYLIISNSDILAIIED